MKKGLRSLLITVGGGAVVFLLVVAFLSGIRSTTTVVVAAKPLPAGAEVRADYLALREIHQSGAMEHAVASIEEAEGQVLTVARAEGDQITADMLGEEATVGLANQLMAGHRAVGIHVNQASGLVGVLRPGDRVAVVAIVDPQDAQIDETVTGVYQKTAPTDATPTPTPNPPSPAAHVVVSGLRVLLVPQPFRYQETLPDESGSTFSVARTTANAQQKSVILLDVPTEPVTIEQDLAVSPAALLPLLDARAEMHLLLEPSADDDLSIDVKADLGALYRAMIGWREPLSGTIDLAASPVVTGSTALTETAGMVR